MDIREFDRRVEERSTDVFKRILDLMKTNKTNEEIKKIIDENTSSLTDIHLEKLEKELKNRN